jgi:hypothetical protein
MRDLAVEAAGAGALAIAIIHGVLGETKIFAKARIEPAWIRLMLRLVWQCSSVAWFGLGILLIASPYMMSDAARHWIIMIAILTYGSAAAANAWASRGRHFGWIALSAVSVLALAGA